MLRFGVTIAYQSARSPLLSAPHFRISIFAFRRANGSRLSPYRSPNSFLSATCAHQTQPISFHHFTSQGWWGLPSCPTHSPQRPLLFLEPSTLNFEPPRLPLTPFPASLTQTPGGRACRPAPKPLERTPLRITEHGPRVRLFPLPCPSPRFQLNWNHPFPVRTGEYL